MVEKKVAIQSMKTDVQSLFQSLDPAEVALIDTTRGLQAIVDVKHKNEVEKFRWYAVIAGGSHIYATADVFGKRVALQRLVMWLENPDQSINKTKHISFLNKVSFDCRVTNLTRRGTRQTVMQNRRPKRNTSSKFKGVIKVERQNGGVVWKTQIKGHLGSMTVGTFENEITAAIHYDAAAYVLFHNSGYYNFPETTPNLDALDHVLIMIERRKQRMKRNKNR